MKPGPLLHAHLFFLLVIIGLCCLILAMTTFEHAYAVIFHSLCGSN